jgi:glyoxylase-like metal-dependent hydrolase (beta-lactamase superfamily II)
MQPINNYVRVIDLTAPLSRATGATMNFVGGGGSTTIGPGNFNQSITAQQADVSQTWTSNSLELYITPWGFLKGAAANNATVSKQKVDGKNYTVLTWSPGKKAPSNKNYVVNGYVNDKNIVDRVETWLEDNIMGDMQILALYSGWKDFGGVMAPAKIVQTRGGWPYFEVTVTAAKANPPDLATLAVPPPPAARGGAGAGAPPANAAGGPPRGAPAAGGAPALPAGGAPAAGRGAAPAMVVTSEKLGDGLYRLTTGAGSYDSVIVEFNTYVMMLEAGQSTARGEAYIAETHRLFPNKPIGYVMNTHPHSDHTGGLPALVAEGATIITQKNNEDFLEKALNTPRTLLSPETDRLARTPKKAKVEAVGEKKVYSDGTRTVEMYHIPGAPHSNGLLIAYIPKEKVLFQGDFSLPTMPGEAANDHIKALVPVLEKLKLVDFDRYINVHASPMPQSKAELWKAVGK